MKFALLPKETRGDAVSATMTLRFGTLESAARAKRSIGGFTGSMLDKGTQHKTRQQIKDTLDRLKARVGIGGGATSATASDRDRSRASSRSAAARARDLREPSFPADEFEKLKQESLAAIEQQKTDPNALAGNLFARISRPPYASDDPRYTRTFAEEAAAIEATTLEQLKQFHASFYGASDATAAVVGDFDRKAIETVLRESFADWKSPSKFVRIAEDYQPSRRARGDDRDAGQSERRLSRRLRLRDARRRSGLSRDRHRRLHARRRLPELAPRHAHPAKGRPQLRRARRLHRQPARQGRELQRLDDLQSAERQKLGAAFREEIERAAREGFTAEELEAAKTGWLKSRQVSRSSDGTLAGTLSSYLFYRPRPHASTPSAKTTVRSLTPEQVNAAIKKHLDYARMISVQAGDFKSAAQP